MTSLGTRLYSLVVIWSIYEITYTTTVTLLECHQKIYKHNLSWLIEVDPHELGCLQSLP